MRKSNHKIAIIGLGYVGLPLAVEFAKKYPVIGFDISKQRIAQLNMGEDKTLEVLNSDLKKVLLGQAKSLSSKKTGLVTSAEIEDISSSNIYCYRSHANRLS